MILKARHLCTLFLCLCLLTAITCSALAADVTELEPDRTGSITVSAQWDGKPVSCGTLALYQVAELIDDSDGYHYQLTGDFTEAAEIEGFPDILEGIRIRDTADLDAYNSEAASVLSAFREKNALKPIQVTQNGHFEDLRLGLYLVVQAGMDGYQLSPFLITVPQSEGDGWRYDTEAIPKPIISPIVSPTPSPTPSHYVPPPTTPPNLPKTGLLWWPVLLLGLGGILCVVFGLCIYRKKG